MSDDIWIAVISASAGAVAGLVISSVFKLGKYSVAWARSCFQPYDKDVERFEKITKIFSEELVSEIESILPEAFPKSILEKLDRADIAFGGVRYTNFLNRALRASEEKLEIKLRHLCNALGNQTFRHLFQSDFQTTLTMATNQTPETDAIDSQREQAVYEAIWAFLDAYKAFREVGNKKFARRVDVNG